MYHSAGWSFTIWWQSWDLGFLGEMEGDVPFSWMDLYNLVAAVGLGDFYVWMMEGDVPFDWMVLYNLGVAAGGSGIRQHKSTVYNCEALMTRISCHD